MAELVWQGKYRGGKRVTPSRTGLPLQLVEAVNDRPPGAPRAPAGGRSVDGRGRWRNRLIWGDKKYVLPSLLPELAGKVNLVYIDPPFDTGADFSFKTEIPDAGEPGAMRPPAIESRAYRDTWGPGGLDSYVQWLYETVVLLHELLADDGSLYLHLDQNVSHYAKAVLDEVFGPRSFQREIVWRIGWVSGYKSRAKNWIRNHDTILFYAKNKSRFTFNKEYAPYPAGYTRRDGSIPTGPGHPMEDVWNASDMDRMDSIQIMSFSGEKVGYPTQKNENLISRIVRASSNTGDLVLDCFAGSGTTAAVAERLGRRWVACDVGRLAIHTTRKRLLAIPAVSPFVVESLGAHERRARMSVEFEDLRGEDANGSYRRLILDLYRADPIAGGVRLHGAKSGRFVHVGGVDAPLAGADLAAIVRDVQCAAREVDGAEGRTPGVDVLAWEFALGLSEMARSVAAEAGVEVRFKSIPRDVLDKRAVEQGDVCATDFLELREVATRQSVERRRARVELVDFTMPSEGLPEDVPRSITHWSQWIDCWAVDWNFESETFHGEWQSHRTRDRPRLELAAQHEYEEPGTYAIVVKVIDLMGCDTTQLISLEIV